MAIASNLGLELATVSNFFMNARRRSMDKWNEQNGFDPTGRANQNSPFSDDQMYSYEPELTPTQHTQSPAYAMPATSQMNHLGNVKAEPTVSF